MENNFSILSLFTSDLMTVFVSLVLVAFSVMSWAIIIEKIRLWKTVKRTPVCVQNNCNLEIAADKIIVPFDKNLSGCLVQFGGLWIRSQRLVLISRSVSVLLHLGWLLRWEQQHWD